MTVGHNQRGERVCTYRRRVMVPKKEHYPDRQPADLSPQE